MSTPTALLDTPPHPAAATVAAAGAAGASFDPQAFAQMQRLLHDMGRLYRERNEALEEVARAHHEALFRLAQAAEMRDNETGVHVLRVGFLSEAMALRMGWTPAAARLLRQAAPMHDVGKIGIPDRVLRKPGPLTPEERQVMEEHPALGARILGRSRIPLFTLAAEVALGHHERWDGTGYPARLAGEAIPMCARIVAVVDFFDALTMDRCYRPAFPDEKALAMLREQAGRAFDPALVDAFIAAAPELAALRDRLNASQPEFAVLGEE